MNECVQDDSSGSVEECGHQSQGFTLITFDEEEAGLDLSLLIWTHCSSLGLASIKSG